ncbi:MAG: hypothetical protein DRP14_00645 [Candidatus Aenigmatarchaeota archaeon]|nr:MAG: hypothetical protein DRP14_00645 [Candidatus Aenigmarchaeota archaeon]
MFLLGILLMGGSRISRPSISIFSNSLSSFSSSMRVSDFNLNNMAETRINLAGILKFISLSWFRYFNRESAIFVIFIFQGSNPSSIIISLRTD